MTVLAASAAAGCSGDDNTPSGPSADASTSPDATSTPDSSTPDTSTPVDSSTGDGSTVADGGTADAAACSNPGVVTSGPADTHCATAGDDGGALVQPTTAASCCIQSPLPAACVVEAGGDQGCPYGATMYGQEADDDDCKYHVVWTIGALCEGDAGTIKVPVTVHVTNKTDGSAMASDANTEVRAEVFTTTPGDAAAPDYCDDNSTHPAPGSEFHLTQSATQPGYWSGTVDFDQPGAWTIRFHFHEECLDVLDDSPHGHAAFHLTLN
jgi:hypothetical protein